MFYTFFLQLSLISQNLSCFKNRKKTTKKWETSMAAVDPWHLKVGVAEEEFPKCSSVINRTCQYPVLIM